MKSFQLAVIIVGALAIFSTIATGLFQSTDAAVQRSSNGFCHYNDITNDNDYSPRQNSNAGCHNSGGQGTFSGHAERDSGFACLSSGGVTYDTHSVNTPSGNSNFQCHNGGG